MGLCQNLYHSHVEKPESAPSWPMAFSGTIRDPTFASRFERQCPRFCTMAGGTQELHAISPENSWVSVPESICMHRCGIINFMKDLGPYMQNLHIWCVCIPSISNRIEGGLWSWMRHIIFSKKNITNPIQIPYNSFRFHTSPNILIWIFVSGFSASSLGHAGAPNDRKLEEPRTFFVASDVGMFGEKLLDNRHGVIIHKYSISAKLAHWSRRFWHMPTVSMLKVAAIYLLKVWGYPFAAATCVVKDGDIVLCDMGCELYCYASDITNSFPAKSLPQMVPSSRSKTWKSLEMHGGFKW